MYFIENEKGRDRVGKSCFVTMGCTGSATVRKTLSINEVVLLYSKWLQSPVHASTVLEMLYMERWTTVLYYQPAIFHAM